MATTTTMKRWDKGHFGVERVCTCICKTQECRTIGWHLVDSHDDRGAAIADARDCALRYGMAFRVVDTHSATEVR